jgi:hypothetical protein
MKRKKFVDIKNEVLEKGNNKYILLSEEKDYINNKSELLFKHLECGFTWKMPLVKFTSANQRCPICTGRILDNNAFKFKLNYIYPDTYTALEEYKTSHEKILIKHNECGHE